MMTVLWAGQPRNHLTGGKGSSVQTGSGTHPASC